MARLLQSVMFYNTRARTHTHTHTKTPDQRRFPETARRLPRSARVSAPSSWHHPSSAPLSSSILPTFLLVFGGATETGTQTSPCPSPCPGNPPEEASESEGERVALPCEVNAARKLTGPDP